MVGLLRTMTLGTLLAAAGCVPRSFQGDRGSVQGYLVYASKGRDSRQLFTGNPNVRLIRDYGHLELSLVYADPDYLEGLKRKGDIELYVRNADLPHGERKHDTYDRIEADGTKLPTGYAADWARQRIKHEALAKLGIDGRTRTVWLMDSGIFAEHDAFLQNTIRFQDFVRYRQEPYDDNMHGTWTAGIVARLLPRATIVAGKSLDAKGGARLSDLLEGFDQAIADNPDVLSMSYGFMLEREGLAAGEADEIIAEALERCHARGILLVAAAGNEQFTPEDGRTPIYPGRSPYVIAVGATDPQNEIAWFSSLGGDIHAPGVWVLGPSHEDEHGYISASGTSASTPIVAAALAALCERHSHRCTLDEVRRLLRERSDEETSIVVAGKERTTVTFKHLNLEMLLE
jgi:subtilisin family serine protease